MLVKKFEERDESEWVPQARTDLRVQHMGEETVVLDRRSEKIHRLNRTASLVWQYCDGQRTVHEIRNEIIRAFDVDALLVERDTELLVEKLEELGLIGNRREREETTP